MPEMVEKLAQASARIPVGMPLDPATQIGPVNNARQWDKVDTMVRTAVSEGAHLATGGGKPDALGETGGFFYAPTILDRVSRRMEIAREEVFGPVLSVLSFEDEEEAIALANDTPIRARRRGLDAGCRAGAPGCGESSRWHFLDQQLQDHQCHVALRRLWPVGLRGALPAGEALAAYTTTKSVWVETAADPTIGLRLRTGLNRMGGPSRAALCSIPARVKNGTGLREGISMEKDERHTAGLAPSSERAGHNRHRRGPLA